jgi:putative salt-induced outer membrane protein
MLKNFQKTSVAISLSLALSLINNNSFAQEIKNNEASWKGGIEAGAKLTNGNSKTESIYAKANLEFKKDKWSDIAKARAENVKENKIRSKEQYYVNNQTRYNYTLKNYSFAELEFVSDRYSGYNYRISEIIGYGRNFITNNDITLSGRIGAGLRQNKLINDKKENNFLARAGGDFEWRIKENINFNQLVNISTDKRATIIESDTSLKILITKTLYFKFSLLIERQSNPPAGVKNTDSTTMLTLGYQFN